MQDDIRKELESFLSDDLVTGLGNIRMSLVWMDDNAPPAVAEDRVRGIKRLDSQLAWLEDRANTVYARLHGYSGPVSLGPATLGDAGQVEFVPVAESEPGPEGLRDTPPPDRAADPESAETLDDAVPPPASSRTPGGLPPPWLSGAEPQSAAQEADDARHAAPGNVAAMGAGPDRPDLGEVAYGAGTHGPGFEAAPSEPTAPEQAAPDPGPEGDPMVQAVTAPGGHRPDPVAGEPEHEGAQATEPDHEAGPDLAENKNPVRNIFAGPLAGPETDATDTTHAADATDTAIAGADAPQATDQTPPEVSDAAGDGDLSRAPEHAAADRADAKADAGARAAHGDEGPAQSPAVAANDAAPRLGDDTQAAALVNVAPLLDETLAEALRAPDPSEIVIDEYPAAPDAGSREAVALAAGDHGGPPTADANGPPTDSHTPRAAARGADDDDLDGAADRGAGLAGAEDAADPETVDRAPTAQPQAAAAAQTSATLSAGPAAVDAAATVVEYVPQDVSLDAENAPEADAAEPQTAPMIAAATVVENGPQDVSLDAENAPDPAASEPQTAPMVADTGGDAAAASQADQAGPDAMEGVETVETMRQDLPAPPAHSEAPEPDRDADQTLVLSPELRAVPEDGSDGPATPAVEEEDLSASIDQLLQAASVVRKCAEGTATEPEMWALTQVLDRVQSAAGTGADADLPEGSNEGVQPHADQSRFQSQRG